MKNFLKFFILNFIFFLFLTTSVNASSVNMDLPLDEFNSETTNTSVSDQNEIFTENTENNSDSSNIENSEVQNNPRVTSVTTSESEDFLTIENIFSIIIIVIGILLILLAGAILIRFK